MSRFLLLLLLSFSLFASELCPWQVLGALPPWGIELSAGEAWKQMQMVWRYGARDANGETSRKFGRRLLEPYVIARVTGFLEKTGALPREGEIERELSIDFPHAATSGKPVTCTVTAGFRKGELVRLDLEWGPITEAQQKAIREEQLHWLGRLREAKTPDETILAAAQVMKLTMATLQYHRGSSGIAHARLVLALEAKGFRIGEWRVETG